MLYDTIAALASAPGGAARGIVRISGPETVACLTRCFELDDERRLGEFRVPQVVSGKLRLSPHALLPCDLYLWPTRRSYTREPLAELHTLGSPPLLAAALQAICAAGARLAEPGEFTLRAFLAGRIDLTQAEAVLGVIDAAGRTELNVALGQLAGGLAAPLASLRSRLLDLLAHLEAGLDFVEEDIEFISPAELDSQLAAASDELLRLVEQMEHRGLAQSEYRLVIVGAPNVGKSSLFNALAGRATALVSDQAGTTRDYVSAPLVLGGLRCLLVDTAGVESPERPASIEAAAQSMGQDRQDEAHLRLFCFDSTRQLNKWEQVELARRDDRRLVVLTKCDASRQTEYVGPAVSTSSASGLGLNELRAAIHSRMTDAAEVGAQVVASTSYRCRDSARGAVESLKRARQAAHSRLGEELVAAELRHALDELGKVAGVVYTDDVLDRIFSRFCIGK